MHSSQADFESPRPCGRQLGPMGGLDLSLSAFRFKGLCGSKALSGLSRGRATLCALHLAEGVLLKGLYHIISFLYMTQIPYRQRVDEDDTMLPSFHFSAFQK